MRVEANGITTLAREYLTQYSYDAIPIIDVFITCKGYKNSQSVSNNFHVLQKHTILFNNREMRAVTSEHIMLFVFSKYLR